MKLRDLNINQSFILVRTGQLMRVLGTDSNVSSIKKCGCLPFWTNVQLRKNRKRLTVHRDVKVELV